MSILLWGLLSVTLITLVEIISLGTVAAVQTISELAAATTKTGSDIYKGANLISGLASEVYVFIKIKDIVWDNKELTTLGNGLDLADLNTLISGGVTLAGLFIGSAVIETAGLILAPLGGALYLYNSDVNHEKITGEKFIIVMKKLRCSALPTICGIQ